MSSQFSDLSEQMYHRLYRLLKRELDPRVIAATLKVPLRTVLSVKARLEETRENAPQIDEALLEQQPAKEFLDLYVYSKIRYAVVHLVGSVVGSQKEMLAAELQKMEESTWKAVAIRMTDALFLDQVAAAELINFHDKLASHARYTAILDPSPDIESALTEFGIDSKIPIFGTERAFEEAAFSRKADSALWRNRQ